MIEVGFVLIDLRRWDAEPQKLAEKYLIVVVFR